MIESFLKKFSDNVYFRKETLEAISGKGIIDLRNIFTVGQLVWINAEIGPGKLNKLFIILNSKFRRIKVQMESDKDRTRRGDNNGGISHLVL